ncbi:hypothetical protein HCN51_40305 [Nonomuraea sp. FMUSA5-5]|uniref:Uncharacterized protein n=1 Tax=Nonomuraea composti TaxID=2720023 RepID=A0ABX1BGZ8_9ACTN|nr:hypothetical protein [Nonomuraea sp. FMUSA5-5]NJP95607.1 hypothetical protein [Nonomuraea sp. FMUSA5-5]
MACRVAALLCPVLALLAAPVQAAKTVCMPAPTSPPPPTSASRAAVHGNSTVGGNARIEDLAWVNSAATVTGDAVVRSNALAQGGVNLGGSVVIGGDAEPATACSSGTYLMFYPDRRRDGGGGEADATPPHPIFTDADLACGGGNPG